MRKYVKEEVWKALNTLAQSSEQIGKIIRSGDRAILQQYLSECQDMAIGIGTIIEKTEGEGTAVVTVLEEYCECLYQVLEGNITAEPDMRRSIESAVKLATELPVKKEIVFLPYKASMWDSLESVWLAAKEDENCDAYVVPIPYFDKNADGSLGEMHYEGNELPDYVPVTDWQTYDVAERRPDAVYIHNPYDQYNLVTSVHPKFYTQELKKCTDMLIYIPYFVCMDDVEEHFCQTPGALLADRVILQSEKVCNTYKRVFMELCGAEEKKKEEMTGVHNNAFWDELQKRADAKYLALGSPKFDKVRNTTREEAEKGMPEEWRQKIYFQDAKGKKKRKKVILYNTSVQALLDHSEQALKKLRTTFNVFRENKDVVLLWRPHPLNATTMQSMLPELTKNYLKLVETYKEEEFGIYDDTADLNRAIALSDAYYGDGGSLPVLYKETGKPILIQNYEIAEENL